MSGQRPGTGIRHKSVRAGPGHMEPRSPTLRREGQAPVAAGGECAIGRKMVDGLFTMLLAARSGDPQIAEIRRIGGLSRHAWIHQPSNGLLTDTKFDLIGQSVGHRRLNRAARWKRHRFNVYPSALQRPRHRRDRGIRWRGEPGKRQPHPEIPPVLSYHDPLVRHRNHAETGQRQHLQHARLQCVDVWSTSLCARRSGRQHEKTKPHNRTGRWHGTSAGMIAGNVGVCARKRYEMSSVGPGLSRRCGHHRQPDMHRGAFAFLALDQ